MPKTKVNIIHLNENNEPIIKREILIEKFQNQFEVFTKMMSFEFSYTIDDIKPKRKKLDPNKKRTPKLKAKAKPKKPQTYVWNPPYGQTAEQMIKSYFNKNNNEY